MLIAMSVFTLLFCTFYWQSFLPQLFTLCAVSPKNDYFSLKIHRIYFYNVFIFLIIKIIYYLGKLGAHTKQHEEFLFSQLYSPLTFTVKAILKISYYTWHYNLCVFPHHKYYLKACFQQLYNLPLNGFETFIVISFWILTPLYIMWEKRGLLIQCCGITSTISLAFYCLYLFSLSGYSRQNSKLSSRIPPRGIHALYKHHPLSVGSANEYDEIALIS